MPGPLQGIKVVDISAVLSGPLATMQLADLGAEVIKVEPPDIGDLLRVGLNRRGGMAAFFANANRGKRSIVLELTRPEGRDIVRELARSADVFVENFRPGAVERMGIGEADLRPQNPGLIYVSVSGYGDSGPYHDRRVYDPIIQGLTGHVAVQTNPDFPIRDLVRNVVSDKASAYTAAQAVLAALFARERGAGGQHIQVPMLDASLAFFWPDGMSKHTLLGDDVQTGPALYDVYRLWETADGHIVYFTATDAEFHGLFRALGHPEWGEDERFATALARSLPENSALLGELLLETIRKWSTRELLERMVAEEVPAGPVLSLEEIFRDPQITHNDSVFEAEHPVYGRYRQARPAARFDRTPQEPGRMPPLHGEHTDEILAELGYDAAARAALHREGVVS